MAVVASACLTLSHLTLVTRLLLPLLWCSGRNNRRDRSGLVDVNEHHITLPRRGRRTQIRIVRLKRHRLYAVGYSGGQR